MKQAEHSNSETEHLIDRAFERDLQRLPEPANAPSARLLQKLVATPHLPVAPSFGWFGSVTAKWLIALALGSATTGVAYFALHTKSPSPSGAISPMQRPRLVNTIDTVDSTPGTVPSPKPSVPPTLPKSYHPAITPHKNARTIISEDSLLRDEIAHPTVVTPSDSAQITFHRNGHP